MVIKMGLYAHMKKLWHKPKLIYKPIVRSMEESYERIEHPSRPTKARSLGYKAKQGFIIVRAKIGRGGRVRPRPRKARKPSKLGTFFTPKHSLQAIAEGRAVRKYPNTEVMNSYYVGETGTHKFYEVILVDRDHPAVIKDKERNWITKQRRRVFRGLTTQGRSGKRGKVYSKFVAKQISHRGGQ